MRGARLRDRNPDRIDKNPLTKFPNVSVVMCVYNGERCLNQAVRSIRVQTFTNFEFLIVDDGSTDATAHILAAHARDDSRIIVIHNNENIGLTRSLNRALQGARGRFIARMDADDVSHPQRIERQLSYLSEHPDVGVVGSWLRFAGLDTGAELWAPPSRHREIVSRLCFESPLYHPTVMMRFDTVHKPLVVYDETRLAAQDYALWVRLALDYGVKLANIPEPLLERRDHSQSVGRRLRLAQLEVARDVRQYQLERLGLGPTPQEMALHHAISENRFATEWCALWRTWCWLRKLKAANRTSGLYPGPEFADALNRVWLRACRAVSLGLGRGAAAFYHARRYVRSPLQ